jgi:acyl-coA ligase
MASIKNIASDRHSFLTHRLDVNLPQKKYVTKLVSAIEDMNYLTVVGGDNLAVPQCVRSSEIIIDALTENPPTLIQYTSGSTGTPRAFVFTRAALWDHARVTAEVMRVERSTPVALAIRRNTAYATSVLLMSSRSDVPVQLFNPTEIRRVLCAAQREAIGTIDASVRFWQTVVSFLHIHPEFIDALSSIKIRGVGGDPLPWRCEKYFRDSGIPLSNGYGLTQAGPNVAINVGEYSSTIPGSCGLPLPGVEVEVRNGELFVRSPFQAIAELVDGVLVPIKEIDDEGWLRTGDAAKIIDYGAIVPIGRLEHVTPNHNGGER